MWTKGVRCAEVSVGCSRATSKRMSDNAERLCWSIWASVAGFAGSNSPGTARPSPYTRSAGEAPMSGFKVVLIDSIAIGNFQNHS